MGPGLIVYLAHIGSFVPAERATIGTVSHMYTRIQSTECVAAHMSAFLIDLRQVGWRIICFFLTYKAQSKDRTTSMEN